MTAAYRGRLLARLALVTATAALVPVAVLGTAGASSSSPLAEARRGTARFHDVAAATAAGYGELRDRDGVACIESAAGGMGIHYVKGALVGDPAVVPATPEVLVYEPGPDGRLRLVAVEYVVLRSSWEAAGNTAPPALFGNEFALVPAGNRYGLPDFYALHAWIWKHNPVGTFADWHPHVSCGA